MRLFHRHDWSDWSITETGKVVTHMSESVVGRYIVQDRFCRSCGKHQICVAKHSPGWSVTSLKSDRLPQSVAPKREASA